MKFSQKTTYSIPLVIDGKEFSAEVVRKPTDSDIDPVFAVVNDRLFLAYAVDDMDADSPFVNQDGIGAVHTAQRGAKKSEHVAMQKALALDDDWNPDLSLIEDMIDADTSHEKAVEVWATARAAGKIGDKYAVPLDCYEHGMQHWSVMGGGMQDQFDTARGAGVWVPDDSAREEANRRAAVYAYGHIEERTLPRCVRKYRAICDASSNPPVEHDEWFKAFEELQAHAKTQPAPSEAWIREGEKRAARELASSALEEFNAWLSGENYGVASEEYVIDGDDLVRVVPGKDTVRTTYGYTGRDWLGDGLKEAIAEMTSGYESRDRQAQKG